MAGILLDQENWSSGQTADFDLQDISINGTGI